MYLVDPRISSDPHVQRCFPVTILSNLYADFLCVYCNSNHPPKT